MRFYGLTCAALLSAVLPVTAQNPAAVPANPPKPSPERLEQILKAWEKRTAGSNCVSTKVTRTTLHPLTNKTTVSLGEIAMLKPNMAKCDLCRQDQADKNDAENTELERWIWSSEQFYEFIPRDKKIHVFDIRKTDHPVVSLKLLWPWIAKDQPVEDDLIFAFLRGMTADAAKKRFHMTLTKESEWYAYIYISPKSAGDKDNFTAAQATFFVKNPNPKDAPDLEMLPMRLWYKQSNGAEVTHTFREMQPNANLKKEDFEMVQLPGYTVEKVKMIP